jgi:GNAT superfamily N-acetyltransferase
MEVREARPEDALAIAEVHVRAWQRGYAGLIDDEFLAALRPEDRAARYELGSEDPAVPTMIVATEAGSVLGFAGVGPSRDADTPEAGEVVALYVDPEHWRGGVGRLLLDESLRRLRESGAEEAVLWVLLGNEVAERFYEAEGWRRDGAERSEQPYGVISRVRRFRRALR